MARDRARKDVDSQSGDKKPRNTAMFLLLGGVAAVVAVAAVLTLQAPAEDPFNDTFVEAPDEDNRPVGAGTIPDGSADENFEGLLNETDRDDFVDPSAPTDAFPNPLLEAPDGTPQPATSIEELEPGPAVDDEVLERMAPETEPLDEN